MIFCGLCIWPGSLAKRRHSFVNVLFFRALFSLICVVDVMMRQGFALVHFWMHLAASGPCPWFVIGLIWLALFVVTRLVNENLVSALL